MSTLIDRLRQFNTFFFFNFMWLKDKLIELFRLFFVLHKPNATHGENLKTLKKFSSDFHLVKNDDFILLNKKTNDIYFNNKNKENYAVSLHQLEEEEVGGACSNETPMKTASEANIFSRIVIRNNEAQHVPHHKAFSSLGASSSSGKKSKSKKIVITPKSKLKSKVKSSKKSLKKVNYNFSSLKKANSEPSPGSVLAQDECSARGNSDEESTVPPAKPVANRHGDTLQTQSIKLIKENLANLFLSKKSHHAANENTNMTTSGGDSASSVASSKQNLAAKTSVPIITTNNAATTTSIDDTELLKAIEIETNKNLLMSQHNGLLAGYICLLFRARRRIWDMLGLI